MDGMDQFNILIIIFGLLGLVGFVVGYKFRMKGVAAVAIGPALLVVFYGFFAPWETDAFTGIGLLVILSGTIPFFGLALIGAVIRILMSRRATS
jgi:hypothetical protein